MNFTEAKQEFLRIEDSIIEKENKIKELEEQIKNEKRILETIEQHLLNIMHEDELVAFKTEDGRVVSIKMDTYYSLRQENKSEFINKMIDTGNEMFLNIHPKKLKSLIENDDEVARVIKDLVSSYDEESLHITKKRRT